jgi:hypothetical protein
MTKVRSQGEFNACPRTIELRESLARTEQRNELDGQIESLALLPTVSSGDPVPRLLLRRYSGLPLQSPVKRARITHRAFADDDGCVVVS